MKILIIKRDKIGDMLLMTPMLEHLRQQCPEANIHVLANDYNAWIVEDNPNIDRLWIYPRARHGATLRLGAIWTQLLQTGQLRRERFDVAIVGGGVISPRAINRALRVCAKRTIAYCADTGYPGVSDPLCRPAELHEVEANTHLLSPLGIGMLDAPIYPVYPLSLQWIDFGKRWIHERGLRERGYIVLGINARRVKRKPTFEQIRRWSDHFRAEWGLDTVLMWQPGGWQNRVYPGDDERMEPLLNTMPSYVHPFCHEGSLFPALGIIWSAATSIFPDGGMAHLASVSPGGVLALFAETDISPHPDHWRPYAPQSDYLEAGKAVAELDDAEVFARIRKKIAIS